MGLPPTGYGQKLNYEKMEKKKKGRLSGISEFASSSTVNKFRKKGLSSPSTKEYSPWEIYRTDRFEFS